MSRKSKKITRGARGQDCDLRIFPYCDDDPEKTVYCHLPCEDKGVGFKSPDWWGVNGCYTCHGIIDGRIKTDLTSYEVLEIIWNAKYRTMKKHIEKGLINVA